MKRTLTNTEKLIILVAVILILSGLFSGMSLSNLFRGHSGRGTSQTFQFKGGFSDIEIKSDISEVRFYHSNDRDGKVVWSGPKSKKLELSTRHGTLTIKEKNKWPWFLHMGINLGSSEMLVYLPENSYKELDIHTDTGCVEIPSGFSFMDVEIDTDTGAVDFRGKAEKKLDIHTDTGRINAERISPENLYVKSDTGAISLSGIKGANDLRAETDTGRITLTDVSCEDLDVNSDTGSISLTNVIVSDKMDIENDTGSVKLDRCDAGSINIKTDTGSITGTILSDKVFTAKSGTGHVSVPDTVRGGSCVLKSGTGSIDISVVR